MHTEVLRKMHREDFLRQDICLRLENYKLGRHFQVFLILLWMIIIVGQIKHLFSTQMSWQCWKLFWNENIKNILQSDYDKGKVNGGDKRWLTTSFRLFHDFLFIGTSHFIHGDFGLQFEVVHKSITIPLESPAFRNNLKIAAQVSTETPWSRPTSFPRTCEPKPQVRTAEVDLLFNYSLVQQQFGYSGWIAL